MKQVCANPACGKPLGVCAGAPEGALAFCNPQCAWDYVVNRPLGEWNNVAPPPLTSGFLADVMEWAGPPPCQHPDSHVRTWPGGRCIYCGHVNTVL